MLRSASRPLRAGSRKAVSFEQKSVAAPRAGDDHRQLRSHRLGNGEPETLASVRVDETVRRRVEGGHLLLAQRPVDVLDGRMLTDQQ